MAMCRSAAPRRRHEILHLADAVRHQEMGDEDVGVGEVELLGAPTVAAGRDAEQAPPRSASRIAAKTLGESTAESGTNRRPVGADERYGVQIADQAVLGDRRVAGTRYPTSAS